MRTRFRSAALALLLLSVLAGFVPATSAQTNAPLSVQLVSQTPILTPGRPLLKLTVLARNTGSANIGTLQIAVIIGAAALTTTGYEDAIASGPGTPVLARTFPVAGGLAAGASRNLSVQVDPSSIPGLLVDSQVYPIRVSIRDGASGAELGGLNSAIVEVVRAPEKPLRLSWTFEVAGVPVLDPQGNVEPGAEPAIAPGGALSAPAQEVASLASANVPFDLAIEPSLIEQLGRMTGGYARPDGSVVSPSGPGALQSRAVLANLRSAAAGGATELTWEPFAWASIPSLLQANLGRDLTTQNSMGRSTAAQILGTAPSLSVTRPPTGALDEQSLHAVAARGTSLVLAQSNSTLRPPQINGFVPPPAAVVAAGNTQTTLVLPDPGTEALIEDRSVAQDPVLAAQITLGELATIWKQEPVPPGTTQRGVAVTLPATLPPAFWGAFANRVTRASFLEPVTATNLVTQVPPPAQPVQLSSNGTPGFRAPYLNALHTARVRLAAFRSMLPATDPQPDRLARNLLVAESSVYLRNEEGGRAWISGVRDSTDAAFAAAMPRPNQVFTFTSRSGTVPLAFSDPGSRPLKVIVQLGSSRVTFPQGSTKPVTLERANQILTFAIATKAVGPSPVTVTVSAPNGHVLGQRTVLVRSTAVNSIALAITLGAGVVLLLLWVRRWFKRPTR